MPGRSLPAAVARVTSAAARLRLDGRLPEPVGRLVRDDLRLRVRDAAWGVTARWLPPVGGSSGTTCSVESFQGRRWRHVGDLRTSLHDLSHDQATHVVEVLRAAGLRPFAVD